MALTLAMALQTSNIQAYAQEAQQGGLDATAAYGVSAASADQSASDATVASDDASAAAEAPAESAPAASDESAAAETEPATTEAVAEGKNSETAAVSDDAATSDATSTKDAAAKAAAAAESAPASTTDAAAASLDARPRPSVSKPAYFYMLLPGFYKTYEPADGYQYVGDGQISVPGSYSTSVNNGRWYSGNSYAGVALNLNDGSVVTEQPTDAEIRRGLKTYYDGQVHNGVKRDLYNDSWTYDVTWTTLTPEQNSLGYDNTPLSPYTRHHIDGIIKVNKNDKVTFAYYVANPANQDPYYGSKEHEKSSGDVAVNSTVSATGTFYTDGEPYEAEKVVDGVTYEFDGWYEDANYKTKADDSYKPDTSRTFYGRYVAKKNASYTVHYMLKDSNNVKLAADRTVSELLPGYESSESAISIPGYKAENPTTQTVTATANGAEITFWYTPDTSELEVEGYKGVYDGKAHGIVVSGTRKGDEVSYSVGDNSSNNEFTDVTTTEVTATVSRDGHVIWTDTATVEITPREITANATDSKVYNGREQVLTVGADRASGVLDGEKLSLNAMIKGTNVGTYTAVDPEPTWSVTKGDGSDSTGNYTLKVTGTLTITKPNAESCTAEVSINGWAYDGKFDSAKTLKSFATSEANGAKVVYTYYAKSGDSWTKLDSEPVNVGTYKVEANWAKTQNYPALTATAEFEVTKLTITVDDSTAVVYNGQDQALTISADKAKGVLAGETLTLDGATVTGKNVGTYDKVADYTWSVAKADGKTDSTGNYDIKVTGKLEITPAEITLTADDKTKVEGDADPTFTSSYSGVVDGETAGWTGEFAREPGEAVGTYAINQGTMVLQDNADGNFLASNYTLKFVPGTLTITAKPETPTTPTTPTTPSTPSTPSKPTETPKTAEPTKAASTTKKQMPQTSDTNNFVVPAVIAVVGVAVIVAAVVARRRKNNDD